MKIEIAHDALAKCVFARASTEDKMRLKVKSFIEERFKDFCDPKRRLLLRVSDLHYIEPYLDAILPELPDDIKEFIRRSENRRFWVRVGTGVLVAVVIVALALTLLSVNATKNNFAALNVDLEAARAAADGNFKAARAKSDSLQAVMEKNKELMASLGLRGDDLRRTRDSLEAAKRSQDSLISVLRGKEVELSIANRKLKEANDKLSENNKRLERDYAQADNERKELKLAKINATKGMDLCIKGYQERDKGNRAEAFRAAAEAWQLDKNNPAATDLLRRIHSDITGTPNWSMPPDKIIKLYAERFKFKLR